MITDRTFRLHLAIGLAAICLASCSILFFAPAGYTANRGVFLVFYFVGLSLASLALAWSLAGPHRLALRVLSASLLLGHALLMAAPLVLIALAGIPRQD